MTKILYHWLLLLDLFRFCEAHFTTYQRFVADQSHGAISPFLGGLSMILCIHTTGCMRSEVKIAFIIARKEIM